VLGPEPASASFGRRPVAGTHSTIFTFPGDHDSASNSITQSLADLLVYRQRIRAIRPRAGARMVCSIFIASSISRGTSFSPVAGSD